MPDNYLYLGLLAILFPAPRLIHCRRDLRDVAALVLDDPFQNHSLGMRPSSTSPDRFHNYQRLMDHWAKVLPEPILHVAYEDVVADLGGFGADVL